MRRRVKEGVYRESVVIENRHGVSIVGDGVGKTILSGTSPLDGLDWQLASKQNPSSSSTGSGGAQSIYYATLPAPLRGLRFAQLFVDGTYAPEARWPNARLDTILDRDATWATMKSGSGWGKVHDPGALPLSPPLLLSLSLSHTQRHPTL